MTELTKEKIIEQFDQEFEKLVDEEQRFVYLMNEYGKGNRGVYVSQLDDSFKSIKKNLRTIRSLAMKFEKNNEESKSDESAEAG